MENLTSLSLQELVALEKCISTVCKKYENVAQMNKFTSNEIDQAEYKRSTNALTCYNNKRELVLNEMENRIKNFA